MLYPWLRPLLFRLDPEQAHGLATRLSAPLGWGPLRALVGRLHRVSDPRTVGGLTFPNAVGLAAGFDKEATWMGWLRPWASATSKLERSLRGHRRDILAPGSFVCRPIRRCAIEWVSTIRAALW